MTKELFLIISFLFIVVLIKRPARRTIGKDFLVPALKVDEDDETYFQHLIIWSDSIRKDDTMLKIDASYESMSMNSSPLNFTSMANKSLCNHRKPTFLCISITSLSYHTFPMLARNMMHSKSFCAWAVYSKSSLVSDLILYASQNQVNLIKVINTSGTNLTSKVTILVDIVKYGHKFDYFFILDENIDLSVTNFHNINNTLCTFPALISQPLKRTSNILSPYPYLNELFWSNSSDSSVLSTFVEMQFPIVNTLFLSWFVSTVVKPNLFTFTTTRSHWGLDNIWCSAADFFIEEQGIHRNVRSCSLFLNAIVTSRQKSQDFDRYTDFHAYYQLVTIARVYKHWCHFGHTHSNYPCGTRERATSSGGDEKCKIDEIRLQFIKGRENDVYRMMFL